MKVVSGITLLDCKDIQAASLQGLCHPNCHHEGKLIHFTPRSPDGKELDWSLKVEADVCCTMWHVVHGLPRSFWEKVSTQSEQGRLDWFGSRTAAMPTVGQRRKVSRPSAPARRVVQPDEKMCLICGEPSEEDVCSKCL